MTNVGIAFTGQNRQDFLDRALESIKSFTPSEFPVVVVDDGATVPLTVPDWVRLVRHDKPRGIPAAKNCCIEELHRLGVEHYLLFDDDTWPVAQDWWRPYVEGAEPHYALCWTHFARDKRPVPKMDILYRDENLVAYTWSMGCLLYVHSGVIDKIGGMFWGFGEGMEEHAEFSQRIHNAGLTSFVHQDHPGVRGKVWAADEHYAAKRSFDPRQRTQLLERNQALRLARIDSTEYVEFRQPRDVVLTSFFTGRPDPQRGGRRLRADPAVLRPLIESTAENIVVLHDCFTTLPVENHRVQAPMCAYQQRWLSQWQWLRDHPEVRWCWMVDSTDTRMLNNPFPHMRPNTLYAGWEPITVGCSWIRSHTPPSLVPWIDANAHQMLLNTGIVGGDRATVMKLCQRMTDLWASTDRKDTLYEMCLFNVAVSEFPNVVTGPQIATLFKHNVLSDPIAFWAHK